MPAQIPWAVILILFSLCSFYYFIVKRKIKNKQRRLHFEVKQQELLAMLRRNKTIK
jgi:uncharacterized membrane protein